MDLAAVPGTGPGGLITREDVRSFVGGDAPGGCPSLSAVPDAGQAGPAGSVGGQARETRTPIKGVRKFTAAAMVASAFTAPHVTEFLTVDVTPTMDLLAQAEGQQDLLGPQAHAADHRGKGRAHRAAAQSRR